jgi:glycosyltransferase involved in cell wall biosynthesis
MIRRGAEKIVLTQRPGPIALPPLTAAKAEPYFDLGRKIADVLDKQPDEKLAFRHPVLFAVGNDFVGFDGQERVWGEGNIGCAAIEFKAFSDAARQFAKMYDKLIAISKWNETFLKELDVAPVHLCYQGIDTSLFMPGPRSGLWKDRFVVFSGGKFEFRKGQDIALAAFKLFQAKHPEALLVCCWQNTLPLELAPFEMAGHLHDLPAPAKVGLELAPWLLKQGLPPQSCICMPFTPNMFMPSTLRECDVAIFPNRCEGGTNLVAMEAMACGVPTYVANNTGQKDLVELLGCGSFDDQRPVKAPPRMPSLEDWGETSVDEVLAALEYVFEHREESQRKAAVVAEKVKAFDWAALNDRFMDVVFDKAV